MTIHEAHLTNEAYGFPTGERRRVEPIALACLHVTGNERTASTPDQHRAALAERNYANRNGSTTSAHYYIARDGWAVEAVDPVRYAAWSNGIVRTPNTDNPGIREVLELRARGFNANEAYVLEVECLGYGSTYPINATQVDVVAELIATQAARTGLAISRGTVHGHWELNSVDRRNCPTPYVRREAFLEKVVARAKALSDDTASGGDAPMLDFTFLYGPDGRTITGTVTIDDPGTAYLDLSDGQLKPIAQGQVKQGVKVRMAAPIKAGAPNTDDWRLGWLIGDAAAFVLDRNVTYQPYPTPVPATATYVVTVGGKTVGKVNLP